MAHADTSWDYYDRYCKRKERELEFAQMEEMGGNKCF